MQNYKKELHKSQKLFLALFLFIFLLAYISYFLCLTQKRDVYVVI